MPERIQRRRTKGWRMPENTVYVGRPSIWGNPYLIHRVGKTTWHVVHGDSWLCDTYTSRTGSEARSAAVRRLRLLLEHDRDPWGKDRIRAELAGKNLACWCPLEDERGNRVPCHADVLLEIANGGDGQ